MTVFFAKYSQQTVGTVHYLAAARLDVKNGALNDPLETQRRERALLRLIGQYWCVLVDENADAGLELIEIRIACEQRFFCRRLIQQTDEKMLGGYEFMLAAPRVDEQGMQNVFELLSNGRRRFGLVELERR